MNGITVKSIVIGIICIILLCSLTSLLDMRYGLGISASFFLPGAILFLILIITVLKCGLKALGIKLTSKESLVIYVMMIVTAGISSVGFIPYMLPTLTAPFYYGTAENRWEEVIVKYIPKWLIPTDPNPSTPVNEAVQYFYEGIPKGISIPWFSWIKPVLAFCIFSFILYFIYFCLATIIRKQWIENERLSFPIVQLPLEIVKEEETSFLPSLFKNKLFLIGCLVVVLLHSYNILTFFIPNLEKIKLREIYLNFLFTEGAWKYMRDFTISIYFSVIGFSFLLPVDVSFSLWFFYLLNSKLQYVLGASLGLNPSSGSRFLSYEAFGGYLVMIVFSIWYGRKHLKEVLANVFNKEEKNREEGMSYKLAFFGLIIGMIMLVFLLSLVGISPIYGFFSILIFFIIVIVLSKIVAEGGVYYAQQNFTSDGIIKSITGSGALDSQTLTMGSIFNHIYIMDLLVLPLPFINDGYKIAEEVRINRRKMTLVMMLSIVIGVIVSFCGSLYVTYHFGGINLNEWFYKGAPQGIYSSIQNELISPKPPKLIEFLTFSGLGGGVLVFIMFLRQKFMWLPFHPIGYVMGFCGDWGPMWRLWFSFFVGWLVKYIIVAYLGGNVFKKVKPLFFGLIIGEVLVVVIVAILQIIFSQDVYRILPSD